jgi:hypothetical protein
MKYISQLLFFACFLNAGHCACGQNLGDISNNYWGGGIYNNLDVAASGGYLTTAPTLGSVTCSSGLAMAKKKGTNGLSLLKFDKPLNGDTALDTSMAECASLYNHEYWLSEDNDEPQAYDSAKAFLEDCPFYPGAYNAFTDILDDASTGAAGGWAPFLVFLKQVLYLNPDTGGWYCNDVLDMLSAVANAPDAESICRYILSSNKCPGFAAIFEQYESSAANGRHMAWLDSVESLYLMGTVNYNAEVKADTLAHPFADTAVPTLFQDSLEILLGPQYAGVQQSTPSAIGSQALLSAQLIENPIDNEEIDVSYNMARTALVTMELRDVLGRMIPLSYAKYQLEQPGEHTATISAPNLPPGTYYLRITTDVGDAITLKVVKE